MPHTSQPLPYTASPYRLALADLLLWARITFVWPPWSGIPSIILPIFPFRSGPLDELYPSVANSYSLVFQLILTTFQALFLITLPVSATLGIGFPLLPPVVGAYVPVWLSWVVGFILLNRISSILLLNGLTREFVSQAPLAEADIVAHQDERWVFVNGVAAGSHWMQSNLDRLSLTFRREIYGIHNQTRGILFDLLECILERTFSYPTPSTRMVYERLLNIVSNRQYAKIVLILHSQGAIEGGLALDWLFATVPAPQLARVEVYTFGSAANHFNNPVATMIDRLGHRIDLPAGIDDNSIENSGSNGYNGDSDLLQQGRVLRHIEHYANSGDYVSRFGILNFRPLPTSMRRRYRHMSGTFRASGSSRGRVDVGSNNPSDPTITMQNRYVGRLFVRHGTGHQLNGNYLDDFFPMNKTLSTVLDGPALTNGNYYMNGTVDLGLFKGNDLVVVVATATPTPTTTTTITTCTTDTKLIVKDEDETTKVKDVSRLWAYRNGMSPDDV